VSVVTAVSFAAYLLAVFAIGIYAHLRTRDFSDYVLGGRRLGPWTAALSAGASDMSGWLLMGLPGLAYAVSAEAVWLALGLLAGTYLNWRLLAPRLRTRSVAVGDALTIPAYLAKRFPESAQGLRVISSLAILVFFVFYTSSGLVAAGKLFATVFAVQYETAVVAGVVAVLSYTVMGGFLAVSWTDLLQGLMMLVALVILPIAAVSVDAGARGALSLEPAAFLDATRTLGWTGTVSALAWGLGYFGQPHILARFKAIRSVADIRISRRIAVTWTALCLLGALGVGATGSGYFPDGVADPERIFMLLADALLHPLLAGIVIAAILAAIMSTADSQLLVCSSVLAEDCYRALLRPAASSGELLVLGRSAVVLVAAVAAFLALDPEATVLGLVAYAWAGFGASFGPVILLSLLWKPMTGRGALAGILAGAATVAVWKQLSGGLFDLYEIVPGFIAGLAGGVAGSFWSARRA